MSQTLWWPLDIRNDKEPMRKKHEVVYYGHCLTGYGYRWVIHSHLGTSRLTGLSIKDSDLVSVAHILVTHSRSCVSARNQEPML